jgi:outer membrane protein
MQRTLPIVLAAGTATILALPFLPGCARTPFAQDSESSLRRMVEESTRRELRDARTAPDAITTSRRDGLKALEISPETMNELDAMSGRTAREKATAPLGKDLLGRDVQTAPINLRSAIQTAMEHNLAVQFARLSPAINESQIVAAEAAFDWTFFNNFQYVQTDSPRVSTSFGGGTGSPAVDVQNAITDTLGLRRPLVSGGRFTIQQDLPYTENRTRGQTNVPDPSSQAALTIQWDQPLLRNAGSEFTQSEIRLARNQGRNSAQTLRRDMIRTLTDTESAYWDLVRAYADLHIVQQLLERGEKVRDQLKERAKIDANRAQIADSNSRVERRKADVLRAQTQLRLASDRVKSLVNDPTYPPGSEVVLIPVDEPIDAPVQFSLAESLTNAMQYRPEIQQAIVAIDDASIRQTVANNQRLPDLSVRLQSRFSALRENLGEAFSNELDGSFIDYLAGLNFEVPLGNRRAEAEFRRRRIERTQTVIAYRNTVQQAVIDVKSALEQVALNYALIAQTRTARVAAAENLRVLQVEKEVLEGITIERLSIELNTQETLAEAERSEVQALTEYHSSIANLFQAMGTALERNNVRLIFPTSDDVRWDESDSNWAEWLRK